jgi:hypothetical protein
MHRFLKKKLVYAYLHELMNVMIFSSLTIKSSTLLMLMVDVFYQLLAQALGPPLVR